jgi:hypothetical protein
MSSASVQPASDSGKHEVPALKDSSWFTEAKPNNNTNHERLFCTLRDSPMCRWTSRRTRLRSGVRWIWMPNLPLCPLYNCPLYTTIPLHLPTAPCWPILPRTIASVVVSLLQALRPWFCWLLTSRPRNPLLSRESNLFTRPLATPPGSALPF